MLSYSVLFVKKKLNRPEVFSKILTNGPKQKLAKIKLNALHKNLTIWDNFFQNRGI